MPVAGMTLVDALKPIIYLSNCIGLPTFSDVHSTGNMFKIKSVYGFVLIVLATGNIVADQISVLKKWNCGLWRNVTFALHSVVNITYVVMNCLSYVVCIRVSKPISVIVDKLSCLETSLRHRDAMYRKVFCEVFLHISFCVTTVIVFTSMDILMNNLYPASTLLAYGLSEMVVNVAGQQFVALVLVLRHHFQDLNARLDVRDKHVYTQLCDVAGVVNRVFSSHVLLTIAYQFVFIVSGWFFSFSSLMISMMNDALDMYTAVFGIGLWAFRYALGLLWLIHNCTETSNEANRTAALVHRLLSKTQDLETREELNSFSLQLLHRKVQFTACGFFPLDFTLLYSIVGAVTTYLVILIQFQLAFVDDRKTNTSNGLPLFS
ncbi:putative gustatory receptor 28a [Periplaneta americana]|uniref:putative gustatory receptor 28a n=1 Tax=Periplaneta americana TaxID=6978 RepID=UPI0037E87537